MYWHRSDGIQSRIFVRHEHVSVTCLWSRAKTRAILDLYYTNDARVAIYNMRRYAAIRHIRACIESSCKALLMPSLCVLEARSLPHSLVHTNAVVKPRMPAIMACTGAYLHAKHSGHHYFVCEDPEEEGEGYYGHRDD